MYDSVTAQRSITGASQLRRGRHTIYRTSALPPKHTNLGRKSLVYLLFAKMWNPVSQSRLPYQQHSFLCLLKKACEFTVSPVQIWQIWQASNWHASPKRWKILGLVCFTREESGNQVSQSDLIACTARKIKASYSTLPLHEENPTEKVLLEWAVQPHPANSFQSIKHRHHMQRNPWHPAPAMKGKLESVKILKRKVLRQRCSVFTTLTHKWAVSPLLLSQPNHHKKQSQVWLEQFWLLLQSPGLDATMQTQCLAPWMEKVGVILGMR